MHEETVTLSDMHERANDTLDGLPMHIFSEISPVFRQAVVGAHMDLPAHLRAVLREDRNTRLGIALSRRSSDVPELAEHPTCTPTPYDTRKHVDESFGRFWESPAIHLAEWKFSYTGDDAADTLALERGPDASSTHWSKPGLTERVYRHEMGHYLAESFDLLDGYFLRTAWNNDVRSNSGPESLEKAGYEYFTHCTNKQFYATLKEGEAHDSTNQGRHETFAELWAECHGGGMRKDIKIVFPNTFAEVKKLVSIFNEKAVPGVPLTDTCPELSYDPTTYIRLLPNKKPTDKLLKRLSDLDGSYFAAQFEQLFHRAELTMGPHYLPLLFEAEMALALGRDTGSRSTAGIREVLPMTRLPENIVAPWLIDAQDIFDRVNILEQTNAALARPSTAKSIHRVAIG